MGTILPEELPAHTSDPQNQFQVLEGGRVGESYRATWYLSARVTLGQKGPFFQPQEAPRESLKTAQNQCSFLLLPTKMFKGLQAALVEMSP